MSPTSSTNYTVIGVSAAGCLSANSATSSVAVNPLPNVTIATSNTLICVGQSASLTANGASTYTWSNNSSGATIVVNPTVTASFTVFGTAANTCTSLATLNQNVSPCTNFGATIKGDFSDIIVYPNPSNGVVFISGLKANEKINLYNSIGIEVPYLISNSDTIFRLEIKNNSNTSNGVYFLKINNSIYKLLLLF